MRRRSKSEENARAIYGKNWLVHCDAACNAAMSHHSVAELQRLHAYADMEPPHIIEAYEKRAKALQDASGVLTEERENMLARMSRDELNAERRRIFKFIKKRVMIC